MWLRWLPWKYVVRYVARKKGFIDPMALMARFNGFAQPAETAAPVELLRAGAVLHARGFINNHVIQHNLDWVWPYWVDRQFDPASPAFIPRAFAMTHINLTQRNWTAVGYPGCPETPVIDARGLLMPFFDSWSLDGWFVPDAGDPIVPSRLSGVRQRLETEGNLRVITEASADGSVLVNTAEAILEEGGPACRVTLEITAAKAGWLAASVRPYNAEGVSFINELCLFPDARGWEINGKHVVRFAQKPDAHLLSRYHDGDVFLFLARARGRMDSKIACEVGMATGAALYRIEAGTSFTATFSLPLASTGKLPEEEPPTAEESWRASRAGGARIVANSPGGGRNFSDLYADAETTALLLSPGEVYAGSYTYKRFWYRDAAIIIHALMCAGYRDVAERALDFCVKGQTRNGYFKSQEGEWDSNGQVLWALGRYVRLFNVTPKPEWLAAIRKAVHWILRKRLADKPESPHAGLLPAGFSAEHLGPNDYYYWDDFWTLAGLRLAAEMLRDAGDPLAEETELEASRLSEAIDRSLEKVAARIGSEAMPASPYRRLDSGAVGSIAAGFPLQVWPARDPRLTATLDYLCTRCMVHGAFFHDISHSGINPYLSLEIAQCLLRAGDPRYKTLLQSIADLASPTGQWPEAIHPQLGTGCMGDGQHAWAAAEWLMMMRNCFLFEEEFEDVLVVGAGLSLKWCDGSGEASFGPAPTRFGPVTVALKRTAAGAELTWSARWFDGAPKIDVRFADRSLLLVEQAADRCRYRRAEEP